MLTTFEELSALNHNKMSAAVNLPARVARHNHNLNGTNLKQMLHSLLVEGIERLVEVPNTVRQRFRQRVLIDLFQDWLDIFQWCIEESIIVVISNGSIVKVRSRGACLLSVRCEDHRGLIGRHLCDGAIGWPCHCHHQ